MYPPRSSPRTASAANNLQTNPTRTNNQRDLTSERSSPYSDIAPYSDRDVDEGEGEMIGRADQMSEADQRHIQKVNQVIQVRSFCWYIESMGTDTGQNFFTKAALTIISSRTILPQSINKAGELKLNKWVRTLLCERNMC